ncbi:hypothetical protein CUMW_269470 [Citrus unshiu]|uniref:Uncharacterized protein n=1 Tax=Citrus unshiu TaxID=55188 RepID=A0A2H5QWZ7_CITUN|nr:hypothetical protein CUMW_269470 [Citrus unshiu]
MSDRYPSNICDLQGFEKVLAVKFPPQGHDHFFKSAVAAKRLMVKDTEQLIKANVRMKIVHRTWPSMIFKGRQQFFKSTCGCKKIDGHQIILSLEALRSSTKGNRAKGNEDSRRCSEYNKRERLTDDLLKKAYTTGHLRMSWLSSKVPRWLISKNAIVSGLGLLGIKQDNVDSIKGEIRATKARRKRIVRRKVTA